MSGILDNKSRVIDAIITYEGKRQLAEGTFSINYATFTDSHVVYEPDSKEGHVDPTKKIYLEAHNVPHDQIVFEADDSGRLTPFNEVFSQNKKLLSGKLKKIETNYVSGTFTETIISGSEFASQIEGILTSSVDNFKKLQVISTIDRLFDDDDFALSKNEVNFEIRPNSENLQMVLPTHSTLVDSLFNDEKLRNLINFRWLPPIRKISNGELVDKTNLIDLSNRGYALGNYPPWGQIEPLTFSDINLELKSYEKDSKTIYFDPTSRDNDIIAQFFEITDNEARKLDVIDYGRVYNNSQNIKVASHHVFFIGKLINDDNGSDSFIHLFTLVFGSSEEDF
jgi:hypothetical protein